MLVVILTGLFKNESTNLAESATRKYSITNNNISDSIPSNKRDAWVEKEVRRHSE